MGRRRVWRVAAGVVVAGVLGSGAMGDGLGHLGGDVPGTAPGAVPGDLLPHPPGVATRPGGGEAVLPMERVKPRWATRVGAKEADELTDQQVVASITKGCDFMLARLDPRVVNERKGDHMDGVRMLQVYALLQAGKATGDERLSFRSEAMAPHVKWLAEYVTEETYVAALQACALSLLPAREEYTRALKRVQNTLIKGMQADGSYTYALKGAGVRDSRATFYFDNSNAQYALLGVWMAADAGVEVPTEYWKSIDHYWRRVQCRDGGWDYEDGSRAHTPSMTAAGVASLYVTTDNLYLSPTLEPRKDAGLANGMGVLAQDFDASVNDLYYLYSIERVGLASGYKFIGTVNWYRQAAANMVANQGRDGGWDSHFAYMPQLGPAAMQTPPMPGDVATPYAVLFLVRGRAPVVFNKLQYEGPWNARERDDANLTNWMSKKTERPINWQVVSLATDPGEWMDAPVLLITGSRDPKFTPEEVAKLRRFVNAGGLIFSTTDGGGAEFTAAVRKYATQVSGGLEMRELPAEHAVFTLSYPVKGPTRMMGVTNGARELWIHSPADMGAAWQSRATAKAEMWNIPANIYFYATGKGSLRTKLQPLAVPEATEKPVRTVTVAQVEYAGNFDPEPGAWPRLGRLARRQARTDVVLVDAKIRNLTVDKARVAHMTGTAAFKLPAGDQVKLRAYLEDGGTLIADACGGSPAFTDSFMAMLKAMYPEGVEPIPLESPLYDGSLADSVKAQEVTYRQAYLLREGQQTKPRLVGLKIKGRYAVIFSAEDITSGLLGTNTWGVMGYSPESAQALAVNALLYAAGRGGG